MIVFNPTAPNRSMRTQPVHAFPSLRGKIIGFIDNSKPNFSNLVDDMSERLKNQYGVLSTIKHSKRGPSIPATESVIAEFSQQCDLVIAGSGD